MKVGIVGCGVMGERHARAAAAYADTTVALYDVDRDRAAKLAAQIGGSVDDGTFADVDALVVSTPTPFHAEWVDRFAGIPTLVEKPAATGLADVSRWAERQLPVACGLIERRNPVAGVLTAMMHGADRVDIVRAHAPAGPRCATALWDLAVHDLDLLTRTGREVDVVSAHCTSEQATLVLRVGAAEARLHVSRTASTRARTWTFRWGSLCTVVDLATGFVHGPSAVWKAGDPAGGVDRQWAAFRMWVNGTATWTDPLGLRAHVLCDDAEAISAAASTARSR